MKNISIIAVFLFISCFHMISQTQTGASFVTPGLDKLVKVPNSPEAAAFAKYGDFDVNMYNGVPNIIVPLHEIQGREFNLPISLTYDASGIKVDQMATWAGLGWNLNAGGRITRLTMGLPDDYINGDYITTNDGRNSADNRQYGIREDLIADVNSYIENTAKIFSEEQEVRDYFLFLNDINNNYIDAQPDIFQVNAPGLSTTVVFDINDNNKPKSLDNPRIKINQVFRGFRGNYEILGWVITNEDGTRYTFGVPSNNSNLEPRYERTKRFGNDLNPNGVMNHEFPSSWVLTKIESPNKKDIFEFDYFDTGYWSQSLLASDAGMSGVRILPNKFNYSLNEVTIEYSRGAGFWLSQLFVSSVKHNGFELVRLDRGARTDIPFDTGVAGRLDQITIFNYKQEPLKFIELDNDHYFNSSALNPLERRLRLDRVIFKDKNQNQVNQYVLEYDRPSELPSRLDKGQDYGGYYNGANNTVLFPRYEYSNFTFEGANRDPNLNNTTIGALKKITYPTGGYTEFTYELNESEIAPQDTANQEWQNVIYASTGVSAGFDTNTPCGLCCQDTYGSATPPKVAAAIFTVTEEGHYNVDFEYNAVGGGNREAYIHRVSPSSCEAGSIQPFGYDVMVDDNCAPKSSGLVWNATSNPVDRVYLTPGCYQITLAIGSQLPNSSMNLTVWRPELQEVGGNRNGDIVDRPGLRVQKISSFASDGVFASGKSYEYLQQKNNFLPVLSKINGDFLERTVGYPQGDGPMVTYPKVREYIIDRYENSEGYVDYTFYSNDGGRVPHDQPPYQVNYYGDLKKGQLNNSEIFDDSGNMLSNQEVTFFETTASPVNIKGLLVSINVENAHKYPYIKTINGGYSYELVEAQNCPSSSGASQSESEWDKLMRILFHDTSPGPGGGELVLAEGCTLPCLNNFGTGNCAPFVSMMDRIYGALETKENFITASYGGVSVQRDTTFLRTDIGLLENLVTTNETVYETGSGYYFPIETTMTDSKGEIYRTTRTFPDENDPAHADFYQRNILTEVVASKTEKIDGNDNVLKLISATKNDYYVSSNSIVPSKIYIDKKEGLSSNLEERAEFTYYTNGNIKESKPTDGPMTTYVWGYDNMYLVAKIDNADHNQVNGVVYDATVLQSLTSTDAEKRLELDKIRNGLSGAMVTTYTYAPQVGVTSITDPRGYTTYFEYDDFNRLKNTKDEASKMLNEYVYGYRSSSYTNPDNMEQYPNMNGSINGSNEVDFGATATYTVSLTGGSNDFSYTWYSDDTLVGSGAASQAFTFDSGNSAVVKVDIVDNITGEEISLTLPVTINSDLGVVNLATNPNFGLVSDTFTITSSGINAGSGSLSYAWIVDNGTPDAYTGASNFQTSFTTVGPHEVKLVVTDDITGNSIEGSVSINIIEPLPNLTLVASETIILPNNTITFTPTALGSHGIIDITWTVNGPNGSEVLTYQRDEPHAITFDTAGQYEVIFAVNALSLNQSDQASVNITVSDGLSVGDIGPSTMNIKVGDAVTFSDPNINGSGNYTYSWKVQNTEESNVQGDFTFNGFNRQDEYYVKLEVHDNILNQTRTSANVRVNVWHPLIIPDIASSQSTIYTNQAVSFSNGNSVGGSGTNTHSWYVKYENNAEVFEGNTTSLNKNFTNAGTYTVRLRIVDDLIQNHDVEIVETFEVYNTLNVGSLTADFDKIVTGMSVEFTAPTVSGGSNNKNYQWLVNGVQRSTSQGNFIYDQFNSANTYTVTYRVTDNTLNISEEESMTVNVYNPLNTPSFGQPVSHIQVGDELYMATSNNGGGSGSRNYKWYVKFNSGSYSQIPGANGTWFTYDAFSNVGTYTIKFRVTDNNVPTHFKETTKVVNVYAPIQISNSDISTPATVQVNTNTYFNINTAGGGSGDFEYEWDIINQSVTPNYYGGVGTYNEANRNVSNFNMGYEFVGASVRIQCRIHDNVTGKQATVYKTISVNNPSPVDISPFIFSNDTDNDPSVSRLSLTANATGGSGQYIYEWFVDNVLVHTSSVNDNKYEYLILSCSGVQTADVKCVVTDNLSGEKDVTPVIPMSISGCSSGGNN